MAKMTGNVVLPSACQLPKSNKGYKSMIYADQVELADEMMAVVTTGEGGFDMLDYRKVPMPTGQY